MLVPLKDGQQIELEALEAKGRLACPDMARVLRLVLQPQNPWFTDRENKTLFDRALVREEFIGVWKDYLFLARLPNREPVGSAWYQVAPDSSEIGACAFVFVHPSQRGRGIAYELMKHAVAHFNERGGVAMYLGTSNPVARGVYHKVGFADYNGVVMRCINPNFSENRNFDERFFSNAGEARIRDASWADLSRLTALYAYNPHPWFIKDYGGQLYSHSAMPQQRCVTVPVTLLLRSEENSNKLLVMEDTRRRLVGAMSMYSRNSKKRVIALDFLVLPSYMRQLPALVERGYQTARSLGAERVEVFVSEQEREKKEVLQRLDFELAQSLRAETQPPGSEMVVQVYRTSF